MSIKMKVIHYIIAVLCYIAGIFVFCFMKEQYEVYQVNHPKDEHIAYGDCLRIKVLRQGDTIAYKNLKAEMKSSGLQHEIIFYSLVMNKQYHYDAAAIDICIQLDSLFANYPATKTMGLSRIWETGLPGGSGRESRESRGPGLELFKTEDDVIFE